LKHSAQEEEKVRNEYEDKNEEEKKDSKDNSLSRLEFEVKNPVFEEQKIAKKQVKHS